MPWSRRSRRCAGLRTTLPTPCVSSCALWRLRPLARITDATLQPRDRHSVPSSHVSATSWEWCPSGAILDSASTSVWRSSCCGRARVCSKRAYRQPPTPTPHRAQAGLAFECVLECVLREGLSADSAEVRRLAPGDTVQVRECRPRSQEAPIHDSGTHYFSWRLSNTRAQRWPTRQTGLW